MNLMGVHVQRVVINYHDVRIAFPASRPPKLSWPGAGPCC